MIFIFVFSWIVLFPLLLIILRVKSYPKISVEASRKRQVEWNFQRSMYPPFSVSEYLERIEKVYADILDSSKPEDKPITLWLGLDGLRLKADGTMEWISQKTHSPGLQICTPDFSLPDGACGLYADNKLIDWAYPE